MNHGLHSMLHYWYLIAEISPWSEIFSITFFGSIPFRFRLWFRILWRKIELESNLFILDNFSRFIISSLRTHPAISDVSFVHLHNHCRCFQLRIHDDFFHNLVSSSSQFSSSVYSYIIIILSFIVIGI